MCVDIPRTSFSRTPVLHFRVQPRPPGFATAADAFAQVEKVVGLRRVNGLVQPFLEAFSNALGCKRRLVYEARNIVVILALVLLHCSQFVRPFLYIAPARTDHDTSGNEL